MILCDTGPLIALIDVGQAEVHERCRTFLDSLHDRLTTTYPCITEAMYLAGKIGGWPMQQVLWRLLAKDVFDIHFLNRPSNGRMEELMNRYANVPMDMADASLVVAAEDLGVRRVFTLDGDFRVYPFDDGGFFEVVL